MDPPPVSRKLQHGAATTVERSSTIQAPPQAFSALHRLEVLQMAPDFRHPSTHPLFVLRSALCCFVSIFIYLSATHFAIDDAANPSQLASPCLIFCSLHQPLIRACSVRFFFFYCCFFFCLFCCCRHHERVAATAGRVPMRPKSLHHRHSRGQSQRGPSAVQH